MRTMRIKLLGVLATLLLGATASFGQAVYYSASEGGVVIDCTMMPKGTILAESMADANNDCQLVSHTELDPANTVYPKLVVATEDLSDGSYMLWADAVTAAQEYENDLSNNTDWRLPNNRELMLIWVLKDKIVEAATGGGSDASFQSDGYWSSTVSYYNKDYRWSVTFVDGGTFINYATSPRYARAVREIALPQAD